MQSHPEAKRYKERLTTALKAAKICVFEVDLTKQLYTFFENAEDIFGVPGETILRDVQAYSPLPPHKYQEAVSAYFAHPDDADTISHAFRRIFEGKQTTYQARMRAANSEYIWCKLDVTPVLENGSLTKMIGVITDISHTKSRTDFLERAIMLDSFTGLYNKKYFMDLAHALQNKEPDKRHALILTDIDHFKAFNDSFGHATGDSILLLVADKLRREARPGDIAGRFGGDEFILFLRDIPSPHTLTDTLQKLILCENESHHCTNSIGVSIYPDDATDIDSLFDRADKALYHSKLTRGTFSFYSDIKDK